MTATQIGWAVLFAPTGDFTLEANVIFETYALALTFVKTDPTAVVGKVISVSTGNEKGVYMIEAKGTNGSLKKVGSDIDLSNYATKNELSNYATKDDVSSVYKFKGSKATYNSLPTEDNTSGDTYNIESEFTITKTITNDDGSTEASNITYPAGTNVAWVASGNTGYWDPLGGTSDFLNWIVINDEEQTSLIGD